MPDTSITVAEPRQAAPSRLSTSKPLQHRLSAPLSAALDLMVYQGKAYQDAAPEAGLTVRAMRMALDKPHVIRELMRRKQVFRAAASSGNIHRLLALADQPDNKMAALGAIKALEQIDDAPAQRTSNAALPGITVIISTGSADTAHSPVIDHNPLIDNDHG